MKMRFKIEIATNEFELLMKKLQSADPCFRWTRKTDNGIVTKAYIVDYKT